MQVSFDTFDCRWTYRRVFQRKGSSTVVSSAIGVAVRRVDGTCTHATYPGTRRWLQPPDKWMPCELESKELLAVCLKKLRGNTIVINMHAVV